MKSGDKIQAYWNKEWWPGIISELPKRKGGKYRVSFSDNSFYDFLPTKLRVNVNKHSSVTKKTRTNANTNTNSVPSVFVNNGPGPGTEFIRTEFIFFLTEFIFPVCVGTV